MARRPPDWLRFTPRRTHRHGGAFARALVDGAKGSQLSLNAFAAADVIRWPNERGKHTAANVRFTEQTFAEVESLIAAAFVRVARKVIERERALQNQGGNT